MNLLCRIGLHHLEYKPVRRHDDWIKVQRCTRCRQPIATHQKHR